jgi:tetratricopeptide (TPR) repeat protein
MDPMHRRLRLALSLSLLTASLGLAACGARPAPTPDKPAEVVEMEPVVIESQQGDDGKITTEAYDAEMLFQQARGAFDAQHFDEAERLYGKLLERFPQSDLSVTSLYNRGLCLEYLKQYGQAAAHFRRYAQVAATLKDKRDGEFRWGYNMVQTGDFPMALDLYTKLLLAEDLGPADRAECYLRRGISLLRLSRYGEAEKDLRRSLDQAAEAYQNELMGNELAAEAHFRRGEIYQKMCREVSLKLPVESMKDDLAEKVRYFRQSQASFIDALNVRNSYWATASGLKLGELYEDFYTDILSAEVPRDFDKDTKKYYFVELRKKLVPLLEQSLSIYEKNITMSERMGAQNEWVKETEARLDRLRSLIEATHREDADSALTAAAQAGAPTPASAAPASAALPVPATAPAAPAAPITAPAEVPLQDNGSTVL